MQDRPTRGPGQGRPPSQPRGRTRHLWAVPARSGYVAPSEPEMQEARTLVDEARREADVEDQIAGHHEQVAARRRATAAELRQLADLTESVVLA